MLIPWISLGFLGAIFGLVLLPRLLEGHALAVLATAIMTVIAIPMLFAALIFSADVLRGRYPGRKDR